MHASLLANKSTVVLLLSELGPHCFKTELLMVLGAFTVTFSTTLLHRGTSEITEYPRLRVLVEDT